MPPRFNVLHAAALALLATTGPAALADRPTAQSLPAKPGQAEIAASPATQPAAQKVSIRIPMGVTATVPAMPVPTGPVPLERARSPAVPGSPVLPGVDESSSVPLREPAFGYSADRRRGEASRQRLRDQLHWKDLGDAARSALAPLAVQRDQVDASGRALVSLAWSYTPKITEESDREARDMYLNVEGDLVVAGSRLYPNDRVLVTELKGAANASDGYTVNWDRNFALAGASAATINGAAGDIFGNTFVCGDDGQGHYAVWQFSGVDGGTIGSLYVFNAGGTASASAVAVDPIEGLVYVVGTGSGSYAGGFIARHNPFSNLGRNWLAALPGAGTGGPATTDAIRINRYGEIYVVGTNSNHMTLSRFSPIDGSVEWTWQDAATSRGTAIAVDFDGNPYVTAALGPNYPGDGWKTMKFDRSGSVAWTSPTTTTGHPDDIMVDSTGIAYVSGDPGNGNTFGLRKYNAGNGNQVWFKQWGGTDNGEGPRLVALDRLENIYVSGHTFPAGDSKIETRKYAPDGTRVWTVDDSPVWDSFETNGGMHVTGLEVDANGSVYVGGLRVAIRNQNGTVQDGNEYVVIKYEQPYEYVPQIVKSNPTTRIENRSLWVPTFQDNNNDTIASLTNINFNLFSFSLEPLASIINLLTYARISYGIQGNGLAEGGLTFGFVNTDGAIGVNYKSTITGGTFDATSKGELTLTAPPDGGTSGLSAGDPIPLSFTFKPDNRALELIADNMPRLTAELVSSVNRDMTIDAYAHDTTLGTIVPHTALLPTTNITKLNNKSLIKFDTRMFTIPANEWYDIRSGDYPQSEFANAQVRLPRMRPTSSYDKSTALLRSSISEKFVKGRVNLTNLMSFYATGGFVPSITWNDSSCCHEIDVYLAFVQAYFRGDIAVEQDLTLELRPYVKLHYDNGQADVTIALSRTGTAGNYTYTADYTTPFGLPSDGNIQITPTFGTKAVLTNRTGLRFGVYAGFEPVDIDVSASVAGIDVVNLDTCIGCIEQDLIALLPSDSRVGSALNGGKLDLFNQTFPEFTFPTEVTQAPITVVGDVNNQPQLSGFSRAFAPMIIYNQRTPQTQAQFNTLVNVTEPMVAYGAKFTTTTPNLKVRMSHYGRTEDLSYTRINDNSLLVQVPRRFLLLPGVAQIWVQNNNGSSKAIDFPIAFPTPNFTGLADTLWAGDPRWAGDGEVVGDGLIAVDGGTPAGNDSWIARRDYYKYLRTSLWNAGFLPAGHTSDTAQVYFPGFAGWETGSTNVPPDFPTLVAINDPNTDDDDVPLSRFRQLPPLPQYNNDGYFRSNLQESLNRTAGFLNFEIVNPGPGGGASRVRTIQVPAPKPVISEIYPPTVQPGSVASGDSLRLDVRGPNTVPFFQGYEAAKYGNFTTDSVVKVNGVAVTTEYVNPGLLVGVIPASMLTTFANKIITVATPANGTVYHETRLDGTGATVFDGNVTSGGTSDPIMLEVVWPAPVIVSVSQSTLTVGQPPQFPTAVNGAPPPDPNNFTIVGSNFAPGCQVLWNGVVIPSTYVDQGSVRCTISVTQVAATGSFRLEVANPAPNARTSNRYFVQVIPPAPSRQILNGQPSH